MKEIVRVNEGITKYVDLKSKLDEIDADVKSGAFEGLYKASYKIKIGRWKKGEAIGDTFRGVNVSLSWHELERQTGRQRHHLQEWYKLYLEYPEIELYIPVAEKEAEEWAKKRLQGPTVGLGTGNQENYTPQEIITAVRNVLGTIDLDPASCELAQQIIQAEKYYTEDDDSLNQPWYGNVFLNPPYQQPLIKDFANKLIDELPNLNSAILLTNNNTDTQWFYDSAVHADLICFTKGRINFYTESIEKTQPTNGQSFFYFGSNTDKFAEEFQTIGLLVKVIG